MGNRGDRDLCSHIWSFPTKEDLEQFTSRLEKALRQDIENLPVETLQLGGRVDTLETRLDELVLSLQALKDKMCCSGYAH